MQQLYEQDYYQWLEGQIEALRTRSLNRVDYDGIADELEQMNRSNRRALENDTIVILAHLLKWQYQPLMRSGSWRGSIKEHRRRVNKLLSEQPSLKSYLSENYQQWYSAALDWAAEETGLSLNSLPAQCSYPLEQLLDALWLPE